jgi:ParB family chromosome partitioning protein
LIGDDTVRHGQSAPQRTVPIAEIEPGPFQPRGAIDPAALAELAESIRVHGILQPILVRAIPGAPDRFQIIGGERRWRAAQLVPLHEVPVVIRVLDDRQAMAASLVENLQREDLQPIEEAEGYARLLREFNMTQEALGEAVGKSRSHIANTIRLLGLPEPVRDLVREGALTAGHARALLTSPDPVGLARRVVDRGLNVRQTEALVAGKDRSGPIDPARPRDPEITAIERDLAAHLGLHVSISSDGTAGRLTIQYRTLDQLEAVIDLLRGRP